MSAPVTADDVVQGAVRYLTEVEAVTDALGSFPESGTPWIFQHTLWVQIEGSQSAAAVISRAGGWAGPNEHNTARFPRLRLEIFIDPMRDEANNINEPGEAWRRVDKVWDAFDRVLHRPTAEAVMWGEVRTLGCLRLSEPDISPASDGDGVLRLECFYGVIQA